MIVEHLDRRVLGAIRLLDANTGLQISEPMTVESEDAQFQRNRRGYYVIVGTTGLKEHTRTFEQPPDPPPAVESIGVVLTVSDPRGRYLPRQKSFDLPRDPALANAGNANSLFQPLDVAMFPAPAAQPAPGSTVIRATVVDDNGDPLPGALIRVLNKKDAKLRARGLTDWRALTRGEAMVPVSGVPVAIPGDGEGAVIVYEVPMTIEAIYAPSFDPAGPPPDPDHLETKPTGSKIGSIDVNLKSRQTLTTTVTVSLA